MKFLMKQQQLLGMKMFVEGEMTNKLWFLNEDCSIYHRKKRGMIKRIIEKVHKMDETVILYVMPNASSYFFIWKSNLSF